MDDVFTDSLSRYRSVTSYNKGEDIGTEITAAVLNRIEPLRIEIARWLIGLHGEKRPKLTRVDPVDTQVPTGKGNSRIDIAIPVPEHDALIWVEAKHWSREHSDQTEKYWKALGTKSPCGLLFYLTPHGAAPPACEAAEQIYWQDWHEVVASWTSRRQGEDWQIWLAEQYCDYLTSEGLALPDTPLDNLGQIATDYERARKALQTVHGIVVSMLEEEGWSEVDPPNRAAADDRKVGHALEWWCAYEATGYSPDLELQFDFVLDSDGGYKEILAGLIWRPSDQQRTENPIDGHDEWLETLKGEEFEPRQVDGRTRLYRKLPLKSIGTTNPGEQGKRIAEFVDETFRLLRENALPG